MVEVIVAVLSRHFGRFQEGRDQGFFYAWAAADGDACLCSFWHGPPPMIALDNDDEIH